MVRPLGLSVHEPKPHVPPKLVLRGVNRRFLSPDSFLNTIRTKVNEADPHLPTILLFPESVLHGKVVSTSQGWREIAMGKAMPRHEGKRMALDIHNILRAAGKPVYVAYSLTETKPARILSKERYPLVTNSGYLVMPEESNNRRYMVYPKVTTYDKGTTLADSDEAAIKRNSEMPDASIRGVCRLFGKIHRFPRVEIGGKIVELRICRDIGGDSLDKPPALDDHPARMAGERPHLIVVPSNRIDIEDRYLPDIQKQLGLGGSAVFLDHFNGKLMAIDKSSGRSSYYDVGSHRHGDLVIDHQSS